MNCSFCPSKASMKCLCQIQETYLCENHSRQHINSGGSHTIKSIRNPNIFNNSCDLISNASTALLELTNQKVARIKKFFMLSNYFLSEINNLVSTNYDVGILNEDFANFINSAIAMLIENFEEGCRQEIQEKNYKLGQYIGEIQDDEKDGIGVFKYITGDIYIGRWLSNEKHGKGIYYFQTGEIYVGDYIRDKYEGRGEFRFANGDVHKGDFRQGEISGYGIKRLTNGTVYKGQWVKGNLHGDGLITDVHGNLYQGVFKNGLKHGPGVLKTSEGQQYKESYLDGKKVN